MSTRFSKLKIYKVKGTAMPAPPLPGQCPREARDLATSQVQQNMNLVDTLNQTDNDTSNNVSGSEPGLTNPSPAPQTTEPQLDQYAIAPAAGTGLHVMEGLPNPVAVSSSGNNTGIVVEGILVQQILYHNPPSDGDDV